MLRSWYASRHIDLSSLCRIGSTSGGGDSCMNFAPTSGYDANRSQLAQPPSRMQNSNEACTEGNLVLLRTRFRGDGARLSSPIVV